MHYNWIMNASEYEKRLKETGRNDTCPCGSGKKYKKCHLVEDEAAKHKDLVLAAEEREAALAAEKESGEGEDSDASGKTDKKKHDDHQKSGKAHQSQNKNTNIPRRGAV